jgi:uncharacterized damage-inducible protein DinB
MPVSTPVSADVLRTHVAYSGWASARLLEALAELTPEELTRDFQTADHSALGTMVHIYWANLLWLARFEQQPQPLPRLDMPLAELQVEAPALQQEMTQWAAALTDASAAEALSYRDMRGNPYTQPIWQLVLHVVNHATHHRGQVAGFLRSMGHKPPSLDLVAYYRQLI